MNLSPVPVLAEHVTRNAKAIGTSGEARGAHVSCHIGHDLAAGDFNSERMTT